MKPIDAEGFERMFRETLDPWDYRASPFEATKRRVLLRACGGRTHGRALELACAIGETTFHLAPLCLRLRATDASPTALAEARRRCAGMPNVTFRQTLLPRETPRGPFDLIVVSELAYYLPRNAARILAKQLTRAVAPGGRIVILHHIRPFDDAAELPALAHHRLAQALRRTMPRVFHARHSRFDAAAFCAKRPVADSRSVRKSRKQP